VQLSFAQRTEMSATAASDFKKKVQESTSSIETIISNFVQKKHLDFLANDIETFGKMFFQSPNMIKWEYTDPYQYSVIFKEEQLYINDDGDKSEVDLGSNKMFQSLNSLIAKSIKGDLFDDAQFDISYFKEGDAYIVDFKPKRDELSIYIQTFQLTFNKDDAQVEEVKMIEPTGDYTRITFKDRVLNMKVDTAVFSPNE